MALELAEKETTELFEKHCSLLLFSIFCFERASLLRLESRICAVCAEGQLEAGGVVV